MSATQTSNIDDSHLGSVLGALLDMRGKDIGIHICVGWPTRHGCVSTRNVRPGFTPWKRCRAEHVGGLEGVVQVRPK